MMSDIKPTRPPLKRFVPSNSYERVREFHEVFGHPVAENTTQIDTSRTVLRLELIREEFCELLDAAGDHLAANAIRSVQIYPDGDADIVGIADALGDLEYVVNGAALEYGIDLPKVVEEVHRSNMTKLGPDGHPIYRADGKILKGEGYEPPNIERILFG